MSAGTRRSSAGAIRSVSREAYAALNPSIRLVPASSASRRYVCRRPGVRGTVADSSSPLHGPTADDLQARHRLAAAASTARRSWRIRRAARGRDRARRCRAVRGSRPGDDPCCPVPGRRSSSRPRTCRRPASPASSSLAIQRGRAIETLETATGRAVDRDGDRLAGSAHGPGALRVSVAKLARRHDTHACRPWHICDVRRTPCQRRGAVAVAVAIVMDVARAGGDRSPRRASSRDGSSRGPDSTGRTHGSTRRRRFPDTY